MKYGDTLSQRSIPEWGTYNIDYNEIKYLIKTHTSQAQPRAKVITVPGHSHKSKTSEVFEEELYQELFEQHQRIDLFVKSKSGEITGRLNHLHKQIGNLGWQGQCANQRRTSVRRLEKYSKVEGEVLKVGEDIQSLARFVGAQRLAFHKLLKKYQKWTGSSSLGSRFHRDVLSRSTSFSQKNFTPQLDQWTEVLADVRAPFEAGLSCQPKSPKPGKDDPPTRTLYSASGTAEEQCHASRPLDDVHSTASELQSIYTTGSDVDVDTALATLPLGNRAGKTVYWIHPDNLIEIHILLLQYMRLRRRTGSSATSLCVRPESSRRGSIYDSPKGHNSNTKDEIGTIVCDDLQSFAERYNGATIDDIESRPGSIPEEAAGSIRYLSTGEVIVVVGTAITKTPPGPGQRTGSDIRKAKIKRKTLRSLFEFDTLSTASRSESPEPVVDKATATTDPTLPQAYCRVQEWLRDHQDVKPLVCLQRRRSRFIGLANNQASGMWATLDINVTMRKSSCEDLIEFTNPTRDDVSSNTFPYGVLEVRWEGKTGLDLVHALDDSHLTERVRGFSLETHAVATLCESVGMPTPFWLPALNRDIRKIPKTTSLLRRQSSAKSYSPESPSPQAGSISTASVADGPTGSGFSAAAISESPATSIPDPLETLPPKTSKKKRRTRKAHPLHKQLSHSEGPQRYWNEFDDGDEAPEEEAYTIFIDPNAPSPFPGAQKISNLVSAFKAKAKTSSKQARAWLQPSTKASSKRDVSAVDDYFSQCPTTEASSLTSSSSSDDHVMLRNARRYSTFPSYPSTPGSAAASISKAVRDREKLLFWCCITSFIASLLLLLVAGILASTRRKKYVLTADLGGLVGIVSSAVFAVVGVGMMAGRREDVGWVHRWSVLVSAGILGVGNVLLAVSMWDS